MSDLLQYFLSLKDSLHPFCLHSGERGKYSYVGMNPSKVWKVYPKFMEKSGQRIPLRPGENPFDILSEEFTPLSINPQVQCLKEGWVGFWAYEMGAFADESFPKRDLPEDFLLGWWGYYENVQSFDQSIQTGPDKVRFPIVLEGNGWREAGGPPQARSEARTSGGCRDDRTRSLLRANGSPPVPCHPFESKSNKASYLSSLYKILSYIEAGDCYQVNFAQQFQWDCPPGFSANKAFVDLVQKHPAPYSAYLDCGEKKIISLSPEEFISIQGDEIKTSPIKGTRARGETADQDARMLQDLENSEKEKAELLMIVDLERNDLGKVCETGSVKVSQLRKIESFDYVHHAMAEISGKKRANLGPLEVTRALFPGGSITGAPKKRAMEIIQELESTPRSVYTGTIGFYDVSGFTRLNIAIRTLEVEKGKIQFGMGGGIVADSDPQMEYEELFIKARVFLG